MNNTPATDYPEGEDGGRYVRGRQRSGMIWSFVFFGATMIGIVVLTALLFNVANAAFGFVLMKDKVQAATLAVGGVPLEELPKEALVEIVQKKVSKGVVRRLESEEPLAERDRSELYDLVLARVVEPEMVKSWSLLDSLTKRAAIRAEADALPNSRLEFRSWLTLAFINSPQSSNAELAGVRTAILGSLWTILVTILFALPVGVGAAIYLEEYTPDTTFNRLIQTNISNLAGVPSIIYGMLGLAVFVRMLEAVTSGRLFGAVTDPTTANGRTIISAGLTLGLLILPLIILNAQEAVRTVPRSLRQASFGIGATRWQTIWHQCCPAPSPASSPGRSWRCHAPSARPRRWW